MNDVTEMIASVGLTLGVLAMIFVAEWLEQKKKSSGPIGLFFCKWGLCLLSIVGVAGAIGWALFW